MIKNMQHAYTQHSWKFYAFMEPIFSERQIGEEVHVTNSHNFYVFDAKGWCWLLMRDVEIKYVLNQLGNGYFKDRVIYTIDEPVEAFRIPIVDSDEWIQGSFDRGYALESIREALGINMQYLTKIMELEGGE